jgi:hypothetical protein
MAAVTYKVLIDWNNDGDYTDLYETQPVRDAGGITIAAGRLSAA